jgi:hypothetical protein
MSRERWMSVLFAAGSACFLIGPFPGYADLVGARADAVTFFVGSILFTGGGLMQVWLSFHDRGDDGPGRVAWRVATVQSAGTLFFNVTTFRALDTTLSNPGYDGLVWRPDAFGSICFLVSGAIAYAGSPRHGLRPVRGTRGWWLPLVNLLGCVLFGISAVAGYVVPASGSELDLAAANWTTALGAACFLACALATIGPEPDQTAETSRGASPSSASSLEAGTGSSTSSEPPLRSTASPTAPAQADSTSSAATAPPGGSAPATRVTRSGSP